MGKENCNTNIIINNNNNKEEEKDQKNILISTIYKSAAELKLLLTALFIISTILTIFQLLPSNLSFSISDLHRCISTTTTTPPPPPPLPTPPKTAEIQPNGIVKRTLIPVGSAAYNFILMSAYRGGPNSFAINALSSKPLHLFSKPTYQCQWIPNNTTNENTSITSTTTGNKILPDWGFGRVYTVVVINCSFLDNSVIGDENGGKLLVHATTNGGGDTGLNITDSVVALYEQPGSLDLSVYTDVEPKYDYLYCGSSLYGDLSPQRLREWLAYHVRMFGERSHFVFHDAGGVHEEVMEVLKVWMEKGYVTLHDIREEERFDGYYHNQFLVVNDCLHRYRFMTKWMLFFDVDEFIFVEKKSTVKSVFDSMLGFTQFTISQRPMSNKLCLEEDRGTSYRKWGFEKLVYRDTKRGIRRDRKYAVQPRNVFATGVHMSQNFVGKTTHNTEGRIMYYHYHGTISQRHDPCQQLVNETSVKFEGSPYVMDTTMRDVVGAVKMFELKMIGNKLQRTSQ